mgnify:CR=1 FL=1
MGAAPFPNPYDVSGYPRSLAAAYERANIFLANEIDFNRQAIHSDTTNSTFATIRPGRRDKTKGDALRPGNKIHGWEKEVARKTTGVAKKIKNMTLSDRPIDYGCKPCRMRFDKGFPGVQRFGNRRKQFMAKKIENDKKRGDKKKNNNQNQSDDAQYELPNA